ncbi:MAG: hypothetical protein R3B45_09940 [Bdellovibrionota bacterium]
MRKKDHTIKTSQRMHKHSVMLNIAKRLSFMLIILPAALLLSLNLAASLTLTPELIEHTLKSVLQQQTGAKLNIKSTKFNILTGLNIYDLSLYPPNPQNPVGYKNSGPILQTPLLKIAEIKANYELLKIPLGILNILAIQIVKPEINIEKDEKQSNYEGIIAYRQKNFPEEKKPIPDKTNDESFTIPLIPLGSKFLYSPINITVKNVGVQSFTLNYKEKNKNQILKNLEFSGLSLDISSFWEGSNSQLRIFLGSNPDSTVKISVTDNSPQSDNTKALEQNTTSARNTKKKNENKELGKKIIHKITSEINTELLVSDLQKIDLNLNINTKKLKSNKIDLKPIKIKVNYKSLLSENLDSITINTLTAAIDDAFTFKLSGEAKLPNRNFEHIFINLNQNFSINLASISRIAKPFLPDFTATGHIIMDNLKFSGDIFPNDIEKLATDYPPVLNTKIILENIEFFSKKFKTKVHPINGFISVANSQSLSGEGSQIDTLIDLTLDKGETIRESKFGSISAYIEELHINTIARLTYPKISIPLAKVNIESPKIFIDNKKLKTIQEPLFISLDAEFVQDLSKIIGDSELELGKLIDTNISFNCKNKCTKIKLSTFNRLQSLKDIYTIAYPIADLFQASQSLPTSLSGSIEQQLQMQGKISNPFSSDPQTILDTADVTFSNRLLINDLTFKMPINKLSVDNLQLKVTLDGDLKKQNLEIKTTLPEVSLELPKDSPQNKENILKIKNIDINTDITNKLLEGFKISNPIPYLETDIDHNIHINEIALSSLNTQSIKNLNLLLNLHQSRLNAIEVTNLSIDMPDYGLQLKTALDVGLNEKFFPTHFSTQSQIIFDHNSGKTLPANITTSGKATFSTKITSKNMKQLDLYAKSQFEHFFLKLKDQKINKNLLEISDITGEFPLAQTLDISKIIEKVQPTEDENSPQEQQSISESDLVSLNKVAQSYLDKTENTQTESSNIITIVDYNNIKSFYPSKSPILIKKVSAANIDASNIEFDVEVRQNTFALNQFVINILGGKIQGDFKVLLDSKASDPQKILKSLQTSLHITRLNSYKLIEKIPGLEDKSSSSILGSNPYIDASMHLVYDFGNSDIGGGLEITSIGKEQLEMMLYYVDPEENDSTINQIRTALSVGDLKHVSIPIRNGNIGMNVDVRLLGVPLPLPKLSQIPLSQIIRNYTGSNENNNNTSEEEMNEKYYDEIDTSKI